MFWNRVWDLGKEKSWSILINIDQYRSILIRNRHNSCFETESKTLVKKFLINLDQYWSILINIDQYWSGLGIIVVLKQSLRLWSKKSWSILIKLIYIDQYWSILINIDLYWSILIRTRHYSCFTLESETLVKKSPDQYWSILINIDLYWSGIGTIVVLKQSLRLW